MNELYRTYEVLVEESVHPQDERRSNTKKVGRYDENIAQALRDTNDVFQDAVAFNILALASMVGKDGKLLNPLWELLRSPAMKEITDGVVQRLAERYAPLKGLTTAEEFRDKVFGIEQIPLEQRADYERALARTYGVMERQGIKRNEQDELLECAALNVFASNWGSILCDPEGETVLPGVGIYDRLHAELKAKAHSDDELDAAIGCAVVDSEKCHATDFAQSFEKAISKLKTEKAREKRRAGKNAEFAEFVEARRKLTRENISDALNDGLSAAGKDLGLPEGQHKTKAERKKEELESGKQAGDDDDAVEPCRCASCEAVRTHAQTVKVVSLADSRFRRLRYGERDNSFEQVLFRYFWLKDDPGLGAIVRLELRAYVTRKEPIPAPRDHDGNIVDALPFRSVVRFVYPLFGKYCLKPGCKERSPWWEFDCQAFQVAAEDLFKYKLRTIKRELDFEKKRSAMAAYLGVGEKELSKDESPSGRPMKIRGMGGDGRRELMERMLRRLADDFGFPTYGLRPATIGGWAEVRKQFLKLERDSEKHGWSDEELAGKLDDAVDEQQEKNSDGFGSEAFFRKLTLPEFQDLWRARRKCAVPAEPVSDFVRHYTRYSLLVEDMKAVGQPDGSGRWQLSPIRFTWPGTKNRHDETSWRHFDFRASLKQELETPLFLKCELADGSPCYDKLPAQKLTLSARRLKRDKVMTVAGSSIDALWSPPLVLDEHPPKAGKPRKGKKEKAADQEVSFSLMVGDALLGKTPPPVFLKVAIPIEQKEYKKLSEGCIAWESGSLRGHKDGDDKRAYFRWAVDLKTEGREEDGKPEAEKEKEAVGKPKKLKFSASQLWCGDGTKALKCFRVKGRKADEGPREFHTLSVDLGVRFAAACSRLRVFIADESECGRSEFQRARRLSPDGYPTDIRALPYRMQTLRLPGEDAESWQKQENGTYALLREEFGGRGRFPLVDATKGIDEKEVFRRLANAITPASSYALPDVDKLTVPEMGDHLVRRLRRRLSRIKTLYNLRWRVSGERERNPDKPMPEYDKRRTPEQRVAHRIVVAEMLARAAFPNRPREGEEEHPANRSLRDQLQPKADEWEVFRKQVGEKLTPEEAEVRKQSIRKFVDAADWPALGLAIQRQLDDLLGVRSAGGSETADVLAKVANFCLPLRGRFWSWQGRVLSFPESETHPAHKPHIRGMRGLAMRRLEQITDLRQCCQSLGKLEERYERGSTPGVSGVEPYVVPRGESLGDDPCPQLLEKRNGQREERVNQIAHMILAEALGLELEDPSKVEWMGLSKKEAKSVCDLHGRYRHATGDDGGNMKRCDVIILEDLSRYRTSQDRPRHENSQLMNWAHRAVITKLCDIAKPFGVTIVLVDAAYSSRFHCASGLPGVRVNEVSRGFHEEMPYVAWAKETKKKGGPTDRAQSVNELRGLFDANEGFAGPLVMVAEGGKEFLSVPHLHEAGTFRDSLINADINAGVSVGLRSLAHPDRYDVFPRLQTEAIADGKLRLRNRRGTLALPGAPEGARDFAPAAPPKNAEQQPEKEDVSGDEEETLEAASRPNLFADVMGCISIADDKRYANAADGALRVQAARTPDYWARVKQICKQRATDFNNDRLEKWKQLRRFDEGSVRPARSKAEAEIEEDQIPDLSPPNPAH